MELDPKDVVDTARSAVEAPEPRGARLNAVVAVTVAILATFMGICKVKDDNIVQAMQQAQADKLDHWAFYQARNIREEVAKSTIVQLQLAAIGRPPQVQAEYQAAIQKYEKFAAEQRAKKEELLKQAEQDQQNYNAANFIDDQFDLSDAALAIAISLLALTALTHQRWLFYVALIPTGFGVLMGLSGLLNWGIHPDALTRLLT